MSPQCFYKGNNAHMRPEMDANVMNETYGLGKIYALMNVTERQIEKLLMKKV